jgi:hypothetical protein
LTRRLVPLLALALASACVHHSSDLAVAGPQAAAPPPAPPSGAGTILFMGVDLPAAGTVIGGHYGGATFDVRQATYQLTESVRARWTQMERDHGEALMRGAGYLVRSVGPSSSDAQQLLGVQYGLTGRVTEFSVRSAGSSEPLTVDAQVDVSWELLDLGSGGPVFGHHVHATARVSGNLDLGVTQVLDNALARLLADTLFLRALGAPRAQPDARVSGPLVRRLPPGGAAIDLEDDDLNPSLDSSVVGRILAGLVMLRGQGGRLGTAVLLTRDGLAVGVGRTARTAQRLRARLASGVEAPVALVRSNAGLDVALLQISCPQACPTVDWDAPEEVNVFTGVVTIGAPETEDQPATPVVGRVGGRWGMASGITLEGMGGRADGGWPVARTSSGRVFALVSTRPGRQSVILLAEVLRALHVRAPASRRR